MAIKWPVMNHKFSGFFYKIENTLIRKNLCFMSQPLIQLSGSTKTFLFCFCFIHFTETEPCFGKVTFFIWTVSVKLPFSYLPHFNALWALKFKNGWNLSGHCTIFNIPQQQTYFCSYVGTCPKMDRQVHTFFNFCENFSVFVSP